MGKGNWKCKVTKETTETTNTYYKIKATCVWDSNDWSYDMSNITGKVTINGSTSTVYTGGINCSSGQTKNLGSKTSTINRTHSSQTISISAEIISKSSYSSGDKTANTTVTVPAKPSYSVTYSASGASNIPGSQTKWFGENLTLSTTKPTKTGYTFVNWKSNLANNPTYNAGATLASNINQAVTMTAQWNENTATLNYNANGGSLASGMSNSVTMRYSQQTTIQNGVPTKTGYTFLGWSTSSTATSASYTAGNTYKAANVNPSGATLYAVWRINTYTINYNGNGNTSGSTSNQTKTYNVAIDILNNGFIKENYNFKEWNTAANGSGTKYDPGMSYTNNSALTLYAIWELAHKKPLIYNTNIYRCDENGDEDDEGKNIRVKFNWETENSVVSVKIRYKLKSATSFEPDINIQASGNTDFVDRIIGDDLLTSEEDYNIQIYVSDGNGDGYENIFNTIVSAASYPIDILNGGIGIAFGGIAKFPGMADFNFKVRTINKNFEAFHDFDTFPGVGVSFDVIFKKNNANQHIGLCVHSDGITRGIYDSKLNGWPLQLNSNNDVIIASHSLPKIKIGNNTYTVATKEPKYLWVDNGTYMSDTQTANLSENITDQNNGIVLVFCEWDITNNKRAGWGYDAFFIPKSIVIPNIGIGWDGVGMSFQMFRNNAPRAYKYLYIYNNKIVGNSANIETQNNVNNKNKVMVAVIGV